MCLYVCLQVVERHSSALAQLAANRVHQETQQAQQLRRLQAERDEAREEVANIETMFADLHRSVATVLSQLLSNPFCCLIYFTSSHNGSSQNKDD